MRILSGPTIFAAVIVSFAFTSNSLRSEAIQTFTRVVAPKIAITPDHENWTYTCGEDAIYNVQLSSDGVPLRNTAIRFRVGPEGLMFDELAAQRYVDAPEMRRVLSGIVTTDTEGQARITAGTLQEPGFLRCVISFDQRGRTYRAVSGAAFSPEKINATQSDPQDFDTFWSSGLTQLSQVEMNPQLTLLPDLCTDKVDVYHVRLQNIPVAGFSRNSAIYGILCEPKGSGPFPAILYVPGAGVRPYSGKREMAERGVITFEIGIHGIPLNLPPEVYQAISNSIGVNYFLNNLDDRDRNYFRRVYLGCVRANDFLVGRKKFNGKQLLVTGSSQGGQLSIVTAALDPRVTGVAVTYPAYCDVTGYLHGRAGGWPHIFRLDRAQNRTDAKIAATSYYDTVNFARRLKVSGYYTWGYNDEVCPPTSMFAAFNSISAPKQLAILLESGHAYYSEQSAAVEDWLLDTLQISHPH